MVRDHHGASVGPPPRPMRPIGGIGLSGQMHGVVPTDAAGRPVRPAMLWADARALDQLAVYRDLPDRMRARLANPLTPGMAGPLLAWLAANEPESYAATRWALQPKDWIRGRAHRAVRRPSPATPRPPCCTTSPVMPGISTWSRHWASTRGCCRRCCQHAGAPGGDLLASAADQLGLDRRDPGRRRRGRHRGRRARVPG